MTRQGRIFGALYGSLVGDALGVPVEFMSRDQLQQDPVTDMRGHGTHDQPAGTWSDDGAMLLCAADSLVETGFDPQDMGDRFVRWRRDGFWTAHGDVFDIGFATSEALARIEVGTPAVEAGGRGVRDNGNGSLMRMLPVSLACGELDDAEMSRRVQQASAITHAHDRSRLACVFSTLLVNALAGGKDAATSLEEARKRFTVSFENHLELPVFSDLLTAPLEKWPQEKVDSEGYVISTLTASIWCLLTTDSFADCVLRAVNLGADTDTTGCVAGGYAGLLYGFHAIPRPWVEVLPRQEDLCELFDRFYLRLGELA